jgi:hypothetical protein
MPGMPHMLAKGELFPVVEDYVSSVAQRLTLLENLKNRAVPSWKTGVLWPTAVAHVWEHWLGKPTFDAASGQFRQPTTGNPSTETATGFWQHWRGPAEAILRETLLRAIEVSIGVAHEDSATPVKPDGTPVNAEQPFVTTHDPAKAPPGPYSRWWPIEILWVCGAPNFQGWITWRETGTGPTDGQVTVVFTTPPPLTQYPMYMTLKVPLGVDPKSTGPDYKDAGVGDLFDVSLPRGVWVVGSEVTTTISHDTTEPVDLTNATIELFGSDINLSLPAQDIIDAAAGVGVTITVSRPSTRHNEPDTYAKVAVVRPSMHDGGISNVPPTFPHPGP